MIEQKPKQRPKASQLESWNPCMVIPFWKHHVHQEDKIYQELPGHLPCPVLEHPRLLQEEHVSKKELRQFVRKVYRDGSFSALCMLAIFELVLLKDDGENSWRALDDDDADGATTKNEDDDDNLLLFEGWPLIQDRISWKNCRSLYQRLQSQLHMVTLPHPLTEYAKQTLLNIPIHDFDQVMQVFHSHKMISKITKNRLQASQLLLDYVASLPPRVVGVLLEHPLQKPSSSLFQSCLPTTCFELSIDTTTNGLKCTLISLYELQSDEHYTVSTRPPPTNCPCFQCRFERDPPTHKNGEMRMTQRLAHIYFQQEKFSQAKELYRRCHDQCVESNNTALAADLWHSIAAVELTQRNFLEAQRHWKQGSHYQSHHTGITLQLEKQKAYRYFEYTNQTTNIATLPESQAIGSSRQLFVTPRLESPATCRQLIEWAQEHASKQGGWTTSRHYDVPTNDVPVHKVPTLLDWFVPWMDRDIQPLLQAQFQTTKRFYVHDAFLVRYEATSSSHFLPLHYDESTHSLILALSEDFEGGGTYFYSLDQTMTPKTGSLVSFRGNKLLHGGNVVTQGVRFILAVFLYLDGDSSTSKEQELGGTRSIMSGTLSQESKRQKTSEGGFSFGFF